MKRKGLGKGLGRGYKNIVPRDPYVHSLSAKGVKTQDPVLMKLAEEEKKHFQSVLRQQKKLSKLKLSAKGKKLLTKKEISKLSDYELEDLLEENPSPENTKESITFWENLQQESEKRGFETKWERILQDDLDAKGKKISKARKIRWLGSLRYQYGNRSNEVSKKLFNKYPQDLTTEEQFDILFDELAKTSSLR
jgi:hypothetical protein